MDNEVLLQDEFVSCSMKSRRTFNLKAFSTFKEIDSNISLDDIYSESIMHFENRHNISQSYSKNKNDFQLHNYSSNSPSIVSNQHSETIGGSSDCAHQVSPLHIGSISDQILESRNKSSYNETLTQGFSKNSQQIFTNNGTNTTEDKLTDQAYLNEGIETFSNDSEIIKSINENSQREVDSFLNMKTFSLFTYIKMEMIGPGAQLHQLDSDAFEKIQNFLNVPIMVEQVITYGMLVCFDAYLYVVTYLPIRFCIASLYLLWDSLASLSQTREAKMSKFRRVYTFDLLRGILLLIGSSALRLLHMSRVYHYIRGQTIIKLYVLTSMLEVLDRLFGSFGQDLFESLHVQTKSNPLQFSVLTTFLVTSIYVIIHSGIYFVHIATLLVTVNSAEQALLAVLFLNNFSEIRSFVFKKFDRISVMQLSFADTTERFQLMLFLGLITIVSFAQTGLVSLYSNISIFLCMMLGESLADWMKHAFISKFNSLDSSVYADMSRVLRSDIIRSYKDKMAYDHNYAVTRRIPLGCVTVRFILLALDSPMVKLYFENISTTSMTFIYIWFFVALVSIKIIFGVSLIFLSGWIHNVDLKRKYMNYENFSAAKRSEQRELMNQLSNIERYTQYKGRILG